MTGSWMLACGPYISLADEGPWLAGVVFLVIKPLAYFAYIQAFRYRVSRSIPMSFGMAARLTAIRALLGVVLVGGGTVLLFWLGATGRQTANPNTVSLILGSWVYLYVSRLFAWWLVGARWARIRGRRLVGWVIGGTLLNAGFDLAAVMGLFAGWPALYVLGAMVAFLVSLHLLGHRPSLRARFSDAPLCRSCLYNLTGNLSGICPECGTPIVQPARA